MVHSWHSSTVSCWRPVALSVVVMLGWVAASSAEEPTGTVTFSGPGADLLPSTTFVPHLYEGTESAWSFFDESEQLGIIVGEVSEDPSRASLVTVVLVDVATWLALDFSGVENVTIDDDTIEFQQLELEEMAGQGAITVDGTLTRPSISESDESWGGVKSRFREE